MKLKKPCYIEQIEDRLTQAANISQSWPNYLMVVVYIPYWPQQIVQ